MPTAGYTNSLTLKIASMGVTIEIYQSRIGSHYNFMEGHTSYFQSQFWNEMLLKFDISLLLHPNINFRFNTIHKENAQYPDNIYNIVQLLLRLSNDEDENPGPTINDIVDCSSTIHASFNQGNDLFGSNAGKQCVAMSLSAIVYKEIKSVNIWNQTTLNTIMVCGDNLYGIISQIINKKYLLLTNVPEFVDMNNITFHLEYSDSFSGVLLMTVNNYPFVTLENALNEVFHSLNYKSCLLTIGMNSVAIMKPFPDVFKVFDSHSRDLYGMPSMSGYCVLISVKGIQNLAQYFDLTSQCSASNDYIPFELKGVCCFRVMDVPNDNVIGQSALSGSLENVASPNNREQRYAKLREYNNLRKIQRQNESREEKKTRLEKEKLRKKSSKKTETLEQRKQRLAKMREYNDLARRGQKSLKQKGNISNHEPSDRQTVTESLIRNFHESVSTGPLYICTCCDQLWYKHSVSPAYQLTLKNPDMVKYLQDIVSVDNIKWVCQTCSKHLKKGKVPPCAVVNRMQFPTKPE